MNKLGIVTPSPATGSWLQAVLSGKCKYIKLSNTRMELVKIYNWTDGKLLNIVKANEI